MASKSVVFACLLFVSAVIITSAVSEGIQEQHETVEVENGNPVEESKQRCRYGCCRYDPIGRRCIRCCPPRSAEPLATTQNQNVENGNLVEESKQRCRYGCCRYDSVRRRCIRCCPPRSTEALATTQNENAVEESQLETNEFVSGGN